MLGISEISSGCFGKREKRWIFFRSSHPFRQLKILVGNTQVHVNEERVILTGNEYNKKYHAPGT